MMLAKVVLSLGILAAGYYIYTHMRGQEQVIEAQEIFIDKQHLTIVSIRNLLKDILEESEKDEA